MAKLIKNLLIATCINSMGYDAISKFIIFIIYFIIIIDIYIYIVIWFFFRKTY